MGLSLAGLPPCTSRFFLCWPPCCRLHRVRKSGAPPCMLFAFFFCFLARRMGGCPSCNRKFPLVGAELALHPLALFVARACCSFLENGGFSLACWRLGISSTIARSHAGLSREGGVENITRYSALETIRNRRYFGFYIWGFLECVPFVCALVYAPSVFIGPFVIFTSLLVGAEGVASLVIIKSL